MKLLMTILIVLLMGLFALILAGFLPAISVYLRLGLFAISTIVAAWVAAMILKVLKK